MRTLFGNLTPTHAGVPFGGPWSSARIAATELVHSRLDLLVQHGAEAYRLAVPEQPGWEPGLGSVRPHVHAKALSADGVACAVGSANLDITASYWESEVLLVVEDSTVACALEARVDQLHRRLRARRPRRPRVAGDGASAPMDAALAGRLVGVT